MQVWGNSVEKRGVSVQVFVPPCEQVLSGIRDWYRGGASQFPKHVYANDHMFEVWCDVVEQMDSGNFR